MFGAIEMITKWHIVWSKWLKQLHCQPFFSKSDCGFWKPICSCFINMCTSSNNICTIQSNIDRVVVIVMWTSGAILVRFNNKNDIRQLPQLLITLMKVVKPHVECLLCHHWCQTCIFFCMASIFMTMLSSFIWWTLSSISFCMHEDWAACILKNLLFLMERMHPQKEKKTWNTTTLEWSMQHCF